MESMVEKRKEMIQKQLFNRGIVNQEVLRAFESIPREYFVQEKDKDYAYSDSALSIGYSQTISQPFVLALMTQILHPKKEDNILEIGAGSGYQAAILSKLCRHVNSYEIIPELADFAKRNLQKAGIKNVDIRYGDGTDIKGMKYDKILVSAATRKIPQSWIEHLKDEGTLVVPQGTLASQEVLKYVKEGDRLKPMQKSIPVLFVPLKGKFS